MNLYIVESNQLMRMGLEEALATTSDITLSGGCTEGLQAVEEILAIKPDVALVSINVSGLDASEVTRRILAANASTAVLMLADCKDVRKICQAVSAGARGCVLAQSSAAQIILAIKSVAEGALWVDPAIACAFLDMCFTAQFDDARQSIPSIGAFSLLSKRELEVLVLIAEGNNNKLIAAHLGISPETVKLHVRSITHKLKATDRSQAVAVAIREKLL